MVPCDFTCLRRASSELIISSQWVVELSADSSILTHHYKWWNTLDIYMLLKSCIVNGLLFSWVTQWTNHSTRIAIIYYFKIVHWRLDFFCVKNYTRYLSIKWTSIIKQKKWTRPVVIMIECVFFFISRTSCSLLSDSGINKYQFSGEQRLWLFEQIYCSKKKMLCCKWP